jgi:hypothetical protein
MTACRPQPNCLVNEIYSFEIVSATHWQSASMGHAFIPNYFIMVDGYIEKKMQALERYDGEILEQPHIRSYQGVKNLASFRGGLIGVKYAEAFCIERVIK